MRKPSLQKETAMVSQTQLNFYFKKFFEKFFPPEIRSPYSIIFLIILLMYISFKSLSSSEPETQSAEPAQLDTFIPKGFKIVNITIPNSEVLDSIIGNKGTVDVYVPSVKKGLEPKLLLKKAKILRAPLNPNSYGLLVPESWAPKILKHGNEFIVTIANPDETGTEIVESSSRSLSGVRFDFN